MVGNEATMKTVVAAVRKREAKATGMPGSQHASQVHLCLGLVGHASGEALA